MAELVDEGSPASKLRSLIKRVGANTDTQIDLGTVTAAAPNFQLLIDGMKIELDADDCIIAEHLTEHTRPVTLSGADTTLTLKSVLTVGARVIVAQIDNGQTYVILDRVGSKEAL
ncbi:DUF2577 family protein [Paenibacillus sp. YIM B09110]|uniref:DUF2577 family protein n=1 Tax=Paenibacillus sp. YIM B09110 TaxID=3126102 RepID=UPI00301D7B73